jgi:hypothetical protein
MCLIKRFFTFIFTAHILLMGLACQRKQIDPAETPKALVQQMVAAVGGIDRLYALKDVEYTYIYHDLTNDKKDVSLERYVFDGELSWAHYETREKNVVPQMEGEVNQGFNGSESWMTIDGKLVEDNPQLAKLCDFLRKTNYYWFTMMFKLTDPGVQYKYNGAKTVDGVDYDLIEISFGEGVGDAQDTYLLYINPETKLVDQFLFTVMDFGVAEPFLMKVEYEEIQGVKLPAKRKYVRANWEGEPQNDEWTAAIWTNIKFNNGFDRSMFEKPTT